MRTFFALTLLASTFQLSFALARSKPAARALSVDVNLNLGSHSHSSKLVSTAWYAGWHAEDFPLSAVSWSKYTHLTYAFA